MSISKERVHINGKKKKAEDLDRLNLENVSTASSADCTGLIPSAVNSKSERDAYRELYDYDPEIKKD